MKVHKLVVTGPFSAGKTAFIRTASDIEIVTTEKRISASQLVPDGKSETTVAMDYGQKRMTAGSAVADVLLHLYGTPGQARFEFMWPILSRETAAFILVLDSTDRASFMDVKQILRTFRKWANVPYVVVANKQDLPQALAPEKIHRALSLSADILVIPCVAFDKSAVVEVLNQVCTLLD